MKQLIAKLGDMAFIPKGSICRGPGLYDFVHLDVDPPAPVNEVQIEMASTDSGKTWKEAYRKPGVLLAVTKPSLAVGFKEEAVAVEVGGIEEELEP